MPSVLQDMVSVPLTGVTSGTGNVTLLQHFAPFCYFVNFSYIFCY
jgi:hypothetical protein